MIIVEFCYSIRWECFDDEGKLGFENLVCFLFFFGRFWFSLSKYVVIDGIVCLFVLRVWEIEVVDVLV